jgi:beta-fructofuranosidase
MRMAITLKRYYNNSGRNKLPRRRIDFSTFIGNVQFISRLGCYNVRKDIMPRGFFCHAQCFFQARQGYPRLHPFYEDGAFRLSIAHCARKRPPRSIRGSGLDEDFVSFTEYGTVIPSGAPAIRTCIYTGSVLRGRDGRYHAFYTGHNPFFEGTPRPNQLVMHAVSGDMLHWTKRPEEMFGAPDGYEKDDWRDPFVFVGRGKRHVSMLTAPALRKARDPPRGTAHLTSNDLSQWTIQKPLWGP